MNDPSEFPTESSASGVPIRVNLDMVGCRLNQSEIEKFGRQFRAAGHRLVAGPAEADLVVINTCSVTAAAASDSRQKLRQAHRAGAGRIVVTGCWSTLAPEAAASLPGVTDVVPNSAKDALVARTLGIPMEEFDLEPAAREPLPGVRLRTRAFIKVQDGCDNRCTFCVTTLARGASRSRTIEAVIEEINLAVLGGAQEAVLTGVHLGAWGHDLGEPLGLPDLIGAILDRTDLPRLRLSSLEPWDLDESLLQLLEDPRLCRHLHLPLQSGCERTLRRMARKTTPEGFRRLVEAARARVPEIAITTDLIVGFPGETEGEFARSLEFVREQGFAGGHVFTYSAREGTAASMMPDQVLFEVRKERNQQVRQALAESADRYKDSFIGKRLLALWETTSEMGPEAWKLHGLTDNQLRVTASARRDIWNQITPVEITRNGEAGMEGIVVQLGVSH